MGWSGGRSQPAEQGKACPHLALGTQDFTCLLQCCCEQMSSGAGTCLPHIPTVLAPCQGFQGHLTSTAEAKGVLVSWVLSTRLCLFLVLVPAQISTGAKTDTSTNAPLLLILWGAQGLGLSPVSSVTRSIPVLEQEQGAQRYLQMQMGPLPVMENPSWPSKAATVVLIKPPGWKHTICLICICLASDCSRWILFYLP